METLSKRIEPVSYNCQRLLTGGFDVYSYFPEIGKTKYKPTRFTVSDEKEIDKNLFIQLETHTRQLVQSFLSTKQHQFQSMVTRQNTYNMNAIASLAENVKNWQKNPFYPHLKQFIIPSVELLATHNPASKFYKYDTDLVIFLHSVSAKLTSH